MLDPRETPPHNVFVVRGWPVLEKGFVQSPRLFACLADMCSLVRFLRFRREAPFQIVGVLGGGGHENYVYWSPHYYFEEE